MNLKKVLDQKSKQSKTPFTLEKVTYKKPYPKLGDKCFLQLADGTKLYGLMLMERGIKDSKEYVILRAESRLTQGEPK